MWHCTWRKTVEISPPISFLTFTVDVDLNPRFPSIILPLELYVESLSYLTSSIVALKWAFSRPQFRSLRLSPVLVDLRVKLSSRTFIPGPLKPGIDGGPLSLHILMDDPCFGATLSLRRPWSSKRSF